MSLVEDGYDPVQVVSAFEAARPRIIMDNAAARYTSNFCISLTIERPTGRAHETTVTVMEIAVAAAAH